MTIDTPPPVDKRKVLLVDDHPVVRLGIRQLIDQQPDLTVCGQAEGAHEALECVARLRPDVVVLDLTLKDSDGLEVLKDICALHPAVRVLILSIHAESIYAQPALRAGASGFLTATTTHPAGARMEHASRSRPSARMPAR